jgi:hypothetical protein
LEKSPALAEDFGHRLVEKMIEGEHEDEEIEDLDDKGPVDADVDHRGLPQVEDAWRPPRARLTAGVKGAIAPLSLGRGAFNVEIIELFPPQVKRLAGY